MQQGKNKVLVFFISLACFIAGVAAALGLVYHFISQDVKPDNISKPKKDTMLIKLVDPLYQPATASLAKVEMNAPIVAPLKKLNETLLSNQTDETRLRLQAGRTLLKNNPAPIDMLPLEKKASALSRQSTLKNIFSPTVWLYMFTALIILLVAFFSKKEKLLSAQLVDKDPPELQNLFTVFRTDIGSFRNPRKILRFMNLVKYHYYFLNKNGIVTDDNLKKLMLILLEIQKDPLLMSVEGIAPEKLSTPDWFYEKIQNKDWYPASGITMPDDDGLMMIILKLNIDMDS